jgi:anti-sigma28 factor (negative regulator of flagellin synthesis)
MESRREEREMKIQSSGGFSEIQSLLGRIQQSAEIVTVCRTALHNKPELDKVRIFPQDYGTQPVKPALTEIPSFRRRRVEEIRRLIQNGQYHVTLEVVAEHILRRLLSPGPVLANGIDATSLEEICCDLVGHLCEELAYLEGKRSILLRERESILHHDLEGVGLCMREMRSLRSQGRILEASRQRLRERLASAMGEAEEEGRTEFVIDCAPWPVKSRLQILKHQLEELLQQVETLTQGNRYLMQVPPSPAAESMAIL